MTSARPTIRRALVLGALLLAAVAACGDSDDPDVTDAAAAGDDEAADAEATGDEGATDAEATGDEGANGGSESDGGGGGAATSLGEGPVTIVALGDSLTYGEGDDTGLGFVGRLAESIGALPGREGTTLLNLGISGWSSTGMVEGQDGSPGQLPAAVEAVAAAVAEGRPALATVLIGSNDMWYLYAYGAPEGTTPDEEAAAEDTFRANLERTVTELTDAGAVVVLGLPDDQTLRPVVVELEALQAILPDIAADEVPLMSAMSERLGAVAEEVAAAHGLATVDTNDPFWADEATMATDLVHPNGEGYALLADLWLPVIEPLL